MRRFLLPLLVLLIAGLALLLAWLWWSDAVLIHKCRDAGGRWDPGARVCALDLTRSPASPASPRR